MGKPGANEVVVFGLETGVMVGVYPPDLGEVEDGGEFDFKRSLGFNVAEQDDCLGVILFDEADDELALNVGIAEEHQFRRGSSRHRDLP